MFHFSKVKSIRSMSSVPQRYTMFYDLYIKPHLKDQDHHNDFMKHSFHSKEKSYHKQGLKKHINTKQTLCSICFTETLYDDQDHSICTSCGYSSYKNDVSVLHDGSGTLYKRQKYFTNILFAFEKKTNIPKWDITLSSLSLQEAKKKYKQYYLDVYCLFHSIPKPQIDSREKKLLLALFDQFVIHFNAMRNEESNNFLKKRKNFLNYSLVCHSLFIHIHREDCCSYVLLPTKTKQNEQLPIIHSIIRNLHT